MCWNEDIVRTVKTRENMPMNIVPDKNFMDI